jgi:glycosyltransferase 2 family protein
LANLPPEPVTIRSPLSRTLILTASAILLVLVLLAYRTRGLSFRWSLFWATLGTLDWRWLSASTCLILLTNVVRGARWQVMLRPLGRKLGLWRITSDTAIGMTAGVAFGRVGEVLRPYLIAVQTGLPFSSQAAAWLLERTLDTLAVLILCGSGLIRLPQPALVAGGYSLGAIAALSLLLLLAFRDPGRRAQRRILDAITFLPPEHRDRIAGMMETFSQGLDCTRHFSSLLRLFAYTGLVWAMILAGTFALFRACQATRDLGLGDILVLMAFLTLGSLVQLPAVGGGVQAALILALTRIYRVPLEAASGVAVWLWIVSTLAIVPFGLACAFHEGLNWSKLKLLSAKKILDESEA